MDSKESKEFSFPCTGCGACCLVLPHILSLALPIKEDGSCGNYDRETSKCRIYKDRPLCCRIDKLYEEFFSGMDRTEYYNNQLIHCSTVIDILQLDPKLKPSWDDMHKNGFESEHMEVV